MNAGEKCTMHRREASKKKKKYNRMTTETTIAITIRRALSLTALIKPSFSNNSTNLTARLGLALGSVSLDYYSMFEYVCDARQNSKFRKHLYTFIDAHIRFTESISLYAYRTIKLNILPLPSNHLVVSWLNERNRDREWAQEICVCCM